MTDWGTSMWDPLYVDDRIEILLTSHPCHQHFFSKKSVTKILHTNVDVTVHGWNNNEKLVMSFLSSDENLECQDMAVSIHKPGAYACATENSGKLTT